MPGSLASLGADCKLFLSNERRALTGSVRTFTMFLNILFTNVAQRHGWRQAGWRVDPQAVAHAARTFNDPRYTARHADFAQMA